MKTRHFFSNFGSILAFAIFGTAISTAFIGAAMYYLGEWGVVLKMSWVENALFAALISGERGSRGGGGYAKRDENGEKANKMRMRVGCGFEDVVGGECAICCID